MKRWLALLFAVCLAGCFADVDWREMHSSEGRFSVWMPARVSEEARPLPGNGGSMRQWSARARDTVFAAGYADFAEARRAAMLELRDAVLRNIDGKVDSEQPVQLGNMAGIDVAASGRSGGSALMLRTRLYQRGARVYQLAVLGAPGAVASADVETFFASFKLDR
jgi:hypothetical protein